MAHSNRTMSSDHGVLARQAGDNGLFSMLVLSTIKTNEDHHSAVLSPALRPPTGPRLSIGHSRQIKAQAVAFSPGKYPFAVIQNTQSGEKETCGCQETLRTGSGL
jgi:hypothetical protein